MHSPFAQHFFLNNLHAVLLQELIALRAELTNASHTGTKASTALEFESKMRGSLENRTAQLESELSRTWEQIKDLSEKASMLETTKRHLEIELDKVHKSYCADLAQGRGGWRIL